MKKLLAALFGLTAATAVAQDVHWPPLPRGV